MAGTESATAEHVHSLSDLTRPSVGAPLKSRQWKHGDPEGHDVEHGHIRKFDTFAEPKFGAPKPEPSQQARIEGIGAFTRIVYTKLAARDGDWRRWHRLWPNVKPSPAMMDLFVRLRAARLQETA